MRGSADEEYGGWLALQGRRGKGEEKPAEAAKAPSERAGGVPGPGLPGAESVGVVRRGNGTATSARSWPRSGAVQREQLESKRLLLWRRAVNPAG